MTEQRIVEIGGYRLPIDRGYDRQTHLWVRSEGERRVRFGFDPLGSETSGDLVALSFEPVGTFVQRGRPFGNLEAAKFVGPLSAPLSGTIVAHNDETLANPALANREPLTRWLVELEIDPANLLNAELLRDADEIRHWMTSEIQRFKQRGMIAE